MFARVTTVSIVAILALAGLGALPAGSPLAKDAAPAPTGSLAASDAAGGSAAAEGIVVPSGFEENAGQFPDGVRFLGRTPGIQSAFFPDHVEVQSGGDSARLLFPGADLSRVSGVEPLPGKFNYFRGTQDQWVSGVDRFARVVFEEVHEGIDLVFYHTPAGLLEFDFIVAPGVDPRLAAFQIEAEGTVEAVDGSYVVYGDHGTFSIGAPYIYQGETTIEGAFAEHDGEIRFALGDYDETAPLVIDPQVGYATYVGGGSTDYITDVVTRPGDGPGVVFIAGYTFSFDFETTTGAYDTVANGGEGYVGKLDTDQVGADSLLWMTFIGSYAADYIYALHADTSGVYVTGTTFGWQPNVSPQFPTTPGAYRNLMVGTQDCFVAKFSTDGSSLLYSTLFGGGLTDTCTDIGTDAGGRIVTASMHTSSTPAEGKNSAKTSPYSGSTDFDWYVAKWDPAAVGADQLLSGFFIGGLNWDYLYALKVSGTSVYLGGSTQSPAFPTTPGAYLTTYTYYEAAIVRVDYSPSNFATIGWSTLLGSSSFGFEEVRDIALYDGDVYVTGMTYDSAFPTTAGAYQTTYNQWYDGFVSRFDPSQTGSAQLVASTFLSATGSADDFLRGIAVDDEGVVVSGSTSSGANYPTEMAGPNAAPGSWYDFAVSKLDHGLSELLWSFAYGSSSDDAYPWLTTYQHTVALGSGGDPFVIGMTCSTGLLASEGYDTAGSCWEGYLFRVIPGPPKAKCDATGPFPRGQPITFDATGSDPIDMPIDWYKWTTTTYLGVETAGPSPTLSTFDFTYSPLEPLGPHTMTVEVGNSVGQSSADCVFELVNSPPVPAIVTDPDPAHILVPVALDATASYDPDTALAGNGIVSYAWVFPNGPTCNGPFDAIPTCHFETPGIYQFELTVEDDEGQTATDTIPIDVGPLPYPLADFTFNGFPWSCGGPVNFEFFDQSVEGGAPPVPMETYKWDFENDGLVDAGFPVTSHTYPGPGTYTAKLTVTDVDGKSTSATKDVIVSWATPPKAKFNEVFTDEPYFLGQTLGFKDATAVGSVPLDSWSWDLGDGTTATGQQVSHTYGATGTYTVELTVTDVAGCVDSIQEEVTIVLFQQDLPPGMGPQTPQPEADFTFFPAMPQPGDLVAFKDQSIPGVFPIATWHWSFGAASAITPDATTRFDAPGDYSVTLTISDGKGGSDKITKIVKVRYADASGKSAHQAPIADAGSDVNTFAGQKVTLDGRGSIGESLSYHWRQIDGPVVSLAGSTTQTPSFIAPAMRGDEQQSALVFELIVNDGIAASQPDRVIVRVEPAPGLLFDARAAPDGAVTFVARNVPTGEEVLWAFGDGTEGRGARVVHAYAAAGTYEVTAVSGGESYRESVDVDVPTSKARAVSEPAKESTDIAGLSVGVVSGLFVIAGLFGLGAAWMAFRRR